MTRSCGVENARPQERASNCRLSRRVPVQEAFDLGVADILFILQCADVMADERVDAVAESACGLAERQSATQPRCYRGVATVVDT